MGGLRYEGHRVRHVVPGEKARRLKADRYEVDFSCPDSLGELALLLRAQPEHRVGIIVNLLGAAPSQDLQASAPVSEEGPAGTTLSTLYVAKAFLEDLQSPGSGPGAFFNVTTMDGRFGVGGARNGGVDGAGTVGFSKALKRECPSLDVRAIDLDPNGEIEVMVGRLFEELQTDDGELEVGLDEEGRWVLRLTENKETGQADSLPFLEPESVILVTGGARGITAEVTRALAERAPCRFILVGRSEVPEAEEPTFRELDRGGLRDLLISRMRTSGQTATPAEIEASVQAALNARRSLHTLAALRASGASVEYHSVDVRDPVSFGGLVDDLYRRFGRIDGVLHGAGVIEDKLIPQKTGDSFRRVFDTKVESARTLARRLRPGALKFLVFFSSVSARFGNAGQSDYCAANEYLNKLAIQLNRSWPGRVVSVNWGPWEGGMVSDDLRRLYAERGIPLISVPEGVRACLAEIAAPPDSPAEVTIASGLSRSLPSAAG